MSFVDVEVGEAIANSIGEEITTTTVTDEWFLAMLVAWLSWTAVPVGWSTALVQTEISKQLL